MMNNLKEEKVFSTKFLRQYKNHRNKPQFIPRYVRMKIKQIGLEHRFVLQFFFNQRNLV